MSKPLRVLLDQNIPRAVAAWLRRLKPNWEVFHTAEVGLSGKDDKKIFEWALAQKTLIITFDEDFADRRSFSVSKHYGIVRLGSGPPRSRKPNAPLSAFYPRFQMRNFLVAW